ncbi:hypothetical protein [Saccharopolyspora pogona]|uniref:hypothetical protein n=1 Tax=Saccharopolyspora pogona TaxID=333966 RepID=UPI001CC257C8|nr:hypothetical protein [Saccharopolyspora pogona]
MTLYLYERLPSQQDVGGVQMASDSFSAGRKRQGVADSDSIDGIGDEAYGKFNDANGSLTFRTGNVIVELRYQGSGESQQGATGLGREAIQVALTKAAKDIPQHLRK